MQPVDFTEYLKRRCQSRPGRIAYPESGDPRILRTASRLLLEQAAAEVILFGNSSDVLAIGQQHGIDLDSVVGKIRWVTSGEDPLFTAAEMLRKGEVDAVLAGAVATTAQVIRTGLKQVGLADGVKTVSGSFLMNKPGGALYLYADAGVVIAPTIEQLVDIAVESVKTWTCLVPEVPPVLAFLSYSTKGSAPHETSERMARAAALFQKRCPDVASDGELQFDAAFDAEIGARKCPGSPAAGRANCFIFPDLASGNIAYKITQRLAGFEAYGPILQGLARPLSDLSRGSTVSDIVSSSYVSLLRTGL